MGGGAGRRATRELGSRSEGKGPSRWVFSHGGARYASVLQVSSHVNKDFEQISADSLSSELLLAQRDHAEEGGGVGQRGRGEILALSGWLG